MELRENQKLPAEIGVQYFNTDKKASTGFGINWFYLYLYINKYFMKNQFDPKYNEIRENAISFLKENNISLSKASKVLGLDRGTITKWAKEEKLPIRGNGGSYSINENSFSSVIDEHSAYWLGFMYADGWVMDNNSVGISLKKSDVGHLEKFKKFLSYDGSLYESNVSFTLGFRNQKIGDDLKCLGCIPRKSLKLKFPHDSIVPDIHMKHFIRGYFDGDGHITDPEKYSFHCALLGTYDMLSNIVEFVKLKNVHIMKRNNIYSFQLSGNNARKLLSFMYDDSEVYLDRKYKRYLSHLERYSKRKNYL